MTLFQQEIKACLSMVEYEYQDGKYIISHEELSYLIEGVSLGVIYNKDLADEIYKENN